jgi:hypothetical protein
MIGRFSFIPTNFRLSKNAKRKFDETGWTDEIKNIANSILLDDAADVEQLKGMHTLKFSSLSETVMPEAERALSPEVRREILIMVAGVVRQSIQEAEEQ